MRVVSFDFGYVNLATVIADIDETSYDVQVVDCFMTDLTNIVCNDKDCIYPKSSRRTAHLVHHFIEKIDRHLQEADLVLGELQPIMGLVDVEQLIYAHIQTKYAHKNKKFMRLISPNQMHRAFSMSDCKIQRRIQVVENTEWYLESHQAFQNANEKDHLGDACAFVLYYAEYILPGELRKNPFASFAYGN